MLATSKREGTLLRARRGLLLLQLRSPSSQGNRGFGNPGSNVHLKAVGYGRGRGRALLRDGGGLLLLQLRGQRGDVPFVLGQRVLVPARHVVEVDQ